MKAIQLVFIFLLNLSAITAQVKPCSSPEARQFDFWIGDWKAEWINENGEKVSGTNSIKALWDGCTIEENFNGNPGMNLIGKSYSVYVPAKHKWFQTWIDNQGGYIPLEGNFSDNKMILTTERIISNKKILMRMVYKNIEHDQFDWSWERSDDNGTTWQIKWEIHYTRMKN